MNFEFVKYQGTGNDFIFIDNRSLHFSKNNTSLIAQLCDRKFGIGADGTILLENHPEYDFRMVYYNADGNESSMCGNGGRCIVHFARSLGIISSEAVFEAIDGVHHATIEEDVVSLAMNDVTGIEEANGGVFLDTGSPHHVTLVDDLDACDVFSEGKKIRYETYGTAGANVNFVAPVSDHVFGVRTYERGVEDETLSCGTGVTAVAIAMHAIGQTSDQTVLLHTRGGVLEVSFQKTKSGYGSIFLKGPATKVFKGHWT
ncbi:MAG: diaminopimelate epimerase [Bacteroidota bacterium]